MITVRWIVGSALLTISIVMVIVNFRIFLKGIILRQHAPSWIPFFGGGTGTLGILVVPLPALHSFWWLPLVLDWGSLPGIIHALGIHAIRLLR
jgi:hypothetical protein